jgi:hypothetical protein
MAKIRAKSLTLHELNALSVIAQRSSLSDQQVIDLAREYGLSEPALNIAKALVATSTTPKSRSVSPSRSGKARDQTSKVAQSLSSWAEGFAVDGMRVARRPPL